MSHTIQGPNWECINRAAAWQPRDSQGECVYDGHLWLFGGWFSPQTPNPRDVWKSADGVTWTRTVETAPWVHSDLPASMVLHNRMWLMGGRQLPGTGCSNKVWSSTDGADWRAEGEAGWSPRLSSGFAVFKDRMWILGGTSDFYQHNQETMSNDVWSTADGHNWECVTPNASWSKRAHGQTVVFKNKLWIMGGGEWQPNHNVVNDVWCSDDGKNWEQVTPAAGWDRRIWFSTVVYRDHLWVLGGWSIEHGNFNDVWCSPDGENWTRVESPTIWTPRHEHSAWVFKDAIILAGGEAQPLNSEVWRLQLPTNWPKG